MLSKLLSQQLNNIIAASFICIGKDRVLEGELLPQHVVLLKSFVFVAPAEAFAHLKSGNGLIQGDGATGCTCSYVQQIVQARTHINVAKDLVVQFVSCFDC